MAEELIFEQRFIAMLFAAFQPEAVVEMPDAAYAANQLAQVQENIQVGLLRDVIRYCGQPKDDDYDGHFAGIKLSVLRLAPLSSPLVPFPDLVNFTLKLTQEFFAKANFVAVPTSGNPGRYVVVESNGFPVMLEQDWKAIIAFLDSSFARLSRSELIETAALTVARYMLAYRVVLGPQDYSLLKDFQPAVLAALSKMEAYAAHQPERATQTIREKMNSLSEQISALRDEVASKSAEIGQLVAINDSARTLVEKLPVEFEAALNEARARGATDALKIEWKDRARSSREQVFWSYLLLAILIAGPIALLGLYYELAFAYLEKLGTVTRNDLGDNPNVGVAAVVAVTRLATFGVPLILYFWLIRLAVKFNARSLLMMDDSRARETMLETYFRIIAKDPATENERALMLGAMFRPPPGYEADTGDPPTILQNFKIPTP